MKKIIFLLFILPFICTAESTEMSIASAVDMALKNNIDLKNSNLTLNNQKLSSATSWNSILPDIKLSGSVTENLRSGAYGVSVGASASVSVNANLATDIVQSVLDYRNGKITYNEAKNALVRDVRKYYYNLVVLSQKVRLQADKLETLKKREEMAQKKFDSGTISEIDRLNAVINYKTGEYELKKLNNEFAKAMLNFKYVIGTDTEAELVLTDELPELKSESLENLKLDIDKNTDVLQAYYDLRSAQNNRAAIIGSAAPSFSLGYSVSGENVNLDNGNVSLSVSLPLQWALPFSNTQVSVIQNENNIKIKQNSLAGAKRKAQIEFDGLVMTIKEIKNDMDSLVMSRDAAKSSYELVRRLYDNGSKDYLELKDSENTLFETEINILNAKYEFISSVLDLDYLMGSES